MSAPLDDAAGSASLGIVSGAPAMPAPARHARVFWLSEAFYPPIVGGQEMFAAQLAHALAARGHPVGVVTRQTVPAAPEREMLGAVEVRRIAPAGILKGKGWSAVVPLLGFLLRLAILLVRDARRFDVLVISGLKIIPLAAVPVCLLARKRCILRAESFFELEEAVSAESLDSMSEGSGRSIARLADRVRRLILRRADHVIAISGEIRAQLIERGVAAARIRDIPNAVDTGRFHPVDGVEKMRLREILGIPKDRTVLIFAGRLSRAKGLPMLIHAWPEFAGRHPESHLLIVGSGRLSFDDCEAELREFVAVRGLSGSVTFAGESAEVNRYLQASDVFVFPTEYEGFSLALVEALACALIVVATSVGAAPDLIRSGGNGKGRNGFLFPPKDGTALLRALKDALAARADWPDIARAAQDTARPYDLTGVADRYSELCEGDGAARSASAASAR